MLVVFVEEYSMKAALQQLLPRLGVDGECFQIIAFQGVTNMLRSLPGRLRAWRDPRAHFLLLRDNDGGECSQRKEALVAICTEAGKRNRSKVRIVCQELEAWFLGDLDAVEAAQLRKSIATPTIRNRCRDPDNIIKPSQILRKHFGFYNKTDGARRISEHLDIERNRSPSFHAMVAAIQQLTQSFDTH